MECPKCETEMEDMRFVHGDKDMGFIGYICPKCEHQVEIDGED